MGMKSIWDGKDLPPEGCLVLAHLSSEKAWVPHVVTGYKVTPAKEGLLHRVEVSLKPSHDRRSSKNARLLGDLRAPDAMEAVLEASQEKAALNKARADRYKSDLERVRETVYSNGKDVDVRVELTDLLDEMVI